MTATPLPPVLHLTKNESHLIDAGWKPTRSGRWHHPELNGTSTRPRLWTLQQAINWQNDWETTNQ